MGSRTRMLGTAVALAFTLLLGGIPIIASAAFADFPQCSDGVDNDADGRVDYPVDNDCVSIDDNNESIDTGVFVTVNDNRDQVSPGDTVIYVITLKQQRDTVKLIDVALRAPAQSAVAYASDAGTIQNGSVVWPKVAVFKGATRTLTVHVVTNPYAMEGQFLVTRVTADAVQATDTTMAMRSNAIPYVQNQLQVSITDNRQNALPNDVLDYVLIVKNPESRGTVVDVRAGIPIALRVLDATPLAERMERDVLWRGVSFGPHEEKVFSFRAVVDARVYDRYPIQVTARAGNVVAYDRTIIGNGNGGPFSLFSSISDGRDTARRGDLLTYVIHIDNISGRLDTNASIDASLPIHSEFVSAEEGGKWDGKNVRWLNMQVAPGGTRDLAFTIRVRSDAPNGIALRTTSYVQGHVATDLTVVDDNRPASGRSIYSTQAGYRGPGKYPYYVVPRVHYAAGELSVEKSVDRSTASAGDIVTYSITVQNDTGGDLQNVLVTDEFHRAQLTVSDRGTSILDDDRIVWTIPVLRSGENKTFTYVARLSRNLQAGSVVTNTARAVSGDFEAESGSSSDEADDLANPSGSDDESIIGTTDESTDETDEDVTPYVGMTAEDVTVLPRTGANDSFYTPIVGQSLLSPVGGNESSMLTLFWATLIVTGLVAGTMAGRKFLT